MAFLKPKSEKPVAEVTTLAPPLPPDAVVSTTVDPPAKSMDGTVTKPPEPVTLLMNVDGGLNGQCWRAGQTVVLPAYAADFYLAKGHGVRAK